MEVGLDPGHIVLGGDPAPKGVQPQIFGPCVLWPKGWMDQDATWYGGRPLPGHIVLDGDPKRDTATVAPPFQTMSVVTKWSPISATAKHLFVFILCCSTFLQ